MAVLLISRNLQTVSLSGLTARLRALALQRARGAAPRSMQANGDRSPGYPEHRRDLGAAEALPRDQ